MTAAVVTLALAVLAAIGGLVSLAIGRSNDAKARAADAKAHAEAITKERADHSATTLRAERAEWERDNEKKSREKAEQTSAAWEEAVANAVPNADLDRRNWRDRLLRAALQTVTAQADRAGAVPTEPVDEPVRPATTADGSDAADVSRPLDPDEQLL